MMIGHAKNTILLQFYEDASRPLNGD